MYYEPDHFAIEEIFPPEVIEEQRKLGMLSQIWRLMDGRVLWTLDRLREKYGTTVCNDYKWGGTNKYRVFRPVISLIDRDHYRRFREIKAEWSSFTSQHCFGRGCDCKFKNKTAEEVRQDIRKNPTDKAFIHIAAVEDKVSWLHFDTRSWNRALDGVLFF